MNIIFDSEVYTEEMERADKERVLREHELHQEKSLIEWQKLLKPSVFKKLKTFIENENKRRLANDKISSYSKYIKVVDAIYKIK